MYPKEAKFIKRNLSGVLLLDKPLGQTSNRSLQIVKRFFRAAKAGHTGTLDPMATGLLPVCFGQATKFSAILLNAEKTYQATFKLGAISSTGDAEGEIREIVPAKLIDNNLNMASIDKVLQAFTGKIKQTPPMFSALKHQGKPLYEYARNGQEIDRKPREIFIYDLILNSWVSNEISITVRCGMGTYIRTLVEDIGKALGCGGAYLISLRRSQIGQFELHQAYTIDKFQGEFSIEHDKFLYSVDSLLSHFPIITLNEIETSVILQGRSIANRSKETLLPSSKVRLYRSGGSFLGMGEITEIGTVIPKRLISQNDKALST